MQSFSGKDIDNKLKTISVTVIPLSLSYGLFPLPNSDSDSDSDMDSCTKQEFSIGSDLDSDHLIEMYVIVTEICP